MLRQSRGQRSTPRSHFCLPHLDIWRLKSLGVHANCLLPAEPPHDPGISFKTFFLLLTSTISNCCMGSRCYPNPLPFLPHLSSHSFLALCMWRCLTFQAQMSHSTRGVCLGWSLPHWSLGNPKHLFFLFSKMPIHRPISKRAILDILEKASSTHTLILMN